MVQGHSGEGSDDGAANARGEVAAPLAQRAEASAYYRRIHEVFSAEFVTDGDRRRYVSALLQCFDVNYNNPKHIEEIARTHGLTLRYSHRYEFLLNKKQAKRFLVDDCKIRGITARQIRAVRIEDYKSSFDQRKPSKRGRSSYWFTLAEWSVLLQLETTPELPVVLAEFGRHAGLAI
jgi:hypothetical protein